MKLSDPNEQGQWLTQHIPHRIRASLALTTFLEGHLKAQIPDETERAKKLEFCRDMAAWEGKYAATRWLIDFVGVNSDGLGNPVRRKRHKRHVHDVHAEDLPGGTPFPIDRAEAKILAQVWLGCTQASSHPTAGGEFTGFARDNISAAVSIVIQHLEETAYQKAGLKVLI